jgi:RNA polymerase sigma-70 factor (ECF subfamily)
MLEDFAQLAQWKIGAQAEAPSPAMADSPTEDQELLRQLAKGNEVAFRTLYERYQGSIYGFALHMSGNRATAEEVTQEVFMLLIRSPKSYQPEKGSVAGYLYGIARNLARRAMLHSYRYVELNNGLGPGAGTESGLAMDADVLEDLSQEELIVALRKAVVSLPEQYREAVVLCDLQEMNYAEAAEFLDCSQGTVASRLHRGRAMLKSKLSCYKCVK